MIKIKMVFGFKHGSSKDSGGCSGSFGFRSPRIPETLIPESNAACALKEEVPLKQDHQLTIYMKYPFQWFKNSDFNHLHCETE